MELERRGRRGGPRSWDEGQRDPQRGTSLAWEFCPEDSLALWLLIKKCQLEVTLVCRLPKRTKAILWSASPRQEAGYGEGKSEMRYPHKNGLQWGELLFPEERNPVEKS